MSFDDNQLLDFIRWGDTVERLNMISRVEDCIVDIARWLAKNKLCLNAPKSDMLNSVSTRRTGSVPGIHIGGEWVAKSSCVRNLGVMLDENMDMQAHIKWSAKTRMQVCTC